MLPSVTGKGDWPGCLWGHPYQMENLRIASGKTKLKPTKQVIPGAFERPSEADDHTDTGLLSSGLQRLKVPVADF